MGRFHRSSHFLQLVLIVMCAMRRNFPARTCAAYSMMMSLGDSHAVQTHAQCAQSTDHHRALPERPDSPAAERSGGEQ